MSFLQKRPLATGCAVYLLCVWAFLSFEGEWRGWSIPILFAIAVGSFLLCAILRRKKTVVFAVLVPALLGAMLTYAAVDLPAAYCRALVCDSEVHVVRVQCTESRYSSDYAAEHTVKLRAIDQKPAFGNALLLCEHEMDLSAGDLIEIGVRFLSEEEADALLSERQNGYLVLLSDQADARFLSIASESVWNRLSRSFRVTMETKLDEASAGLLSALLLGNRSYLPVDIPLVFRNLGISHVLAVSGLHLTMVLFGLEWLLRRLTAPRWLRDVLAMLGTACYALLTEMSPSVLRAGGMLILARLASRAHRTQDSPTTLLAALTVIVTLSPLAVLDVGLQLSAAATMGILVVMRGVQSGFTGQRKTILRATVNAAAVSISGLAATLPLSWYYFGTVSLMTVPANLVLSVPIVLCMASGIGFLVLGWIPLIGDAAAVAARITCRLFLSLARMLDGGQNFLLAPDAWVIVVSLLAALLCLILLCLRLKNGLGWRRILPVILSIMLVYGGGWIQEIYRQEDTVIRFLSDGNDDGLLISQDGMTLLCDFSDGSYGSSYALIQTALSMNRDAAPSGYLISHYHQRYLGTVQRMLKQVRIDLLLMPSPQTQEEESLAARIADFAIEMGSDVRYYAADGSSVICVGEADVRVWRTELKRSSHPTVRLQIQCRGRTVGYLGASVHEATPEIMQEWVPFCDTLLLGAHGPVIKNQLPPCGRVICADSETAEALIIEDAVVLNGIDDVYTVVIPNQTGSKDG